MANRADPSNIDEFLHVVLNLLIVVDSIADSDDTLIASNNDVVSSSRAMRVHNTFIDMNSIICMTLGWRMSKLSLTRSSISRSCLDPCLVLSIFTPQIQ
jgi:hypothetical protein